MALICYILLPLVLAGFLLMRYGFRPELQGSEPHCRRCNYLLVGISTHRCPECGAVLSGDGIVPGRRVRHTGVGVIGILCCLVALLLVWGLAATSLGRFNWYHYQPTFLLMRDLRSSSPAEQLQAIQELTRRQQMQPLPAKYVDEIDAMALSRQGATPWDQLSLALIHFAEADYIAGAMTQKLQRQFEQQAVQVSLQVRSVVQLGDQVPVAMDVATRITGDLWINVHMATCTIDGEKKQSLGFQQGRYGGQTSAAASIRSFAYSELGSHKIIATARVQLYQGTPLFKNAQSKLLHQDDRLLSAFFEVVPQVPTNFFSVSNAPALGRAVQGSIKPEGLYLSGAQGYLDGYLTVTNAPTDLAFTVFARVKGQELRLQNLVCGKGSSASYGIGPVREIISTPPWPATCDLVLRSNETLARESLDLHNIWTGEVVYHDVPIARK